MEEANTQAAGQAHDPSAASDKPVIHRVCEACNNMFATHPGEKSLRCPKCTKE